MEDVNSGETVIRKLYQITNSYDLGFDAQIEKLLQMGLERFNLDIAILSRIENNHYTVEHCIVSDNVEMSSGVVFDFKDTYCHIACLADEPTAFEHIGNHAQYASHPAYSVFALESYIGMPIKLNGKLYGTLNFSSYIPYKGKFNAVDIDTIQLMTSWVEVELIRRKQKQELITLNLILEREAYEDSLTLIPNRRAVFKHITADLNRINREQGKVALTIIDIDLFKSINDTYGHKKGDEVLMTIADSLNNDKRDYDFLGRFGGEEFLLWLPNIDMSEAKIICERIRCNIENLHLCKKPITISIGISCYVSSDLQHLDNEKKIEQLIIEADKALYQAKGSGRNSIRLYCREKLTDGLLTFKELK